MRAPQARGTSALDALRRYRWRISFTYGLTLAEDLLELSYPWATGIAINGLLAHNYYLALPIVLAWMARSTIGLIRRMYDTRLYTTVYNELVEETILRQRGHGIPATTVSARSAMSREFVTFFEKDLSILITAIVGVFGSLAMLFVYDTIVGALMLMLLGPVYFVNVVYVRVSYRLNQGLNNQLEEEVQTIDAAKPAGVAEHFRNVRNWRVRLSDAEAFNWAIIEVLSILLFVIVLVRATYRPELGAGEIFAMIVYVWQFMENLDHVPQLLQQLTRLQDIKKRIEAGASVEAIGAEIEKGEEQDAESTRM
ncbi:MAG: hypothetical protein JWN93_1830 [Hyphomicrobiales bacterium]|jgi:ABC-type multidrug transport system fused ATPase/permease subunit|nr:hypothetical protein [Hyphomicrobiales bacterium]